MCYVSRMTRFGSDAIYAGVAEEVDSLGLRPAARKLGVSVGVVRSALARRELGHSNLSALSGALGLDFYIGPPRDHAPATMIDGDEFDTVALYEAEGAAGDGIYNFDAPPIDHLAFSKRWLNQNGINAAACVILTVKGDSMEPSIYNGDLVMVDRNRRQIRSGRIYVFNDGDDGLRIKRLELIPDLAVILRSDNPSKTKSEHRVGEAMNAVADSIVGEVVWSGHTWK